MPELTMLRSVATDSRRPHSPAVLRPDKQPRDPRRPLAHQRAAQKNLTAHLEESRLTGVFEGVMVMPTGAGKTFTSATWLMEKIIAKGGRVLWIAHREDLLKEAARDFHHAAGRAECGRSLTVRIVSRRHSRASEIKPEDDVVLVSAATLARHPEIWGHLVDDPRTFVIVDECHHAFAPTYRTIIDRLRARPTHRLLGLTATPTRTILRERPVLAELFGNKVIFEIGPTELIEQGILARPKFVNVRTHSTIDRGLTPADRDHLRQHGDISPGWLDRIARIESRNHAIINVYLKHRKRYGKTLIFANNIAHAILLTHRLRELGVAADYVACKRRDGRDNRKVLGRFRDVGGVLEVLVNVGLLTEGADYPAIQTVLLARPTISVILIQQMIGRALRGPAVGGTEDANVVLFQDEWRRVDEGRGALDRVKALYTPAAAARRGRHGGRIGDTMPSWESIEAVAPQVRARVPAGRIETTESVAERWYVTYGAAGAERECRPITVYTHQRDGYEACLDYLEQLPADDLTTIDTASLATRFFATCAAPPPSLPDLGLLLAHFRAGGRSPECFGVEDRLACDPRALARLIVEGDLGESTRSDLLTRRYTTLARALYPTLRDYRAAVDDAAYAYQNPGEAAWANPPSPVFEVPPARGGSRRSAEGSC